MEETKPGYILYIVFFVGGKLFFGICLDWCLRGSCFFLFSIQTDSFIITDTVLAWS